MAFLTVDFESYYNRDYSLSKLTIEQYLQDPRFEVIGVSVKKDDEPAQWCTGSHDEIKLFLDQFNWADSACLAHNQMFDGAILKWKFGITPAFFYDTLCMARAIHVGSGQSNSLAALATKYNLGSKGTEVIQAQGMRRADFDKASLDRYGAYCINDNELAYKLFSTLAGHVNESELKLIDLTLRMFIEPTLMLDDALLVNRLAEVRKEKAAMLDSLMVMLGCSTPEEVRQKLASNKQFEALLRSMNVEVPMKESLRTGKLAPAFAKTDIGFIALESHTDPRIQQLCAVRLGTKSTIEESRIEHFIQIGGRNSGLLPIQLNYYGAHTGRWSGAGGVNLQNLPSRDKDKKTLKNSILAPPGHVLINADSSQIEARILAWLAKQEDVLHKFRLNRDIYCDDASRVFGYTVTRENERERWLGKIMRLSLGYGTGARKLQNIIRLQRPEENVPLDYCYDIVNRWRMANDQIVQLWNFGDGALDFLMNWPNMGYAAYLGKRDCVKLNGFGLMLPNGMAIRYPELRIGSSDSSLDSSPGRRVIIHDTPEGPRKIWGGTVIENVVQALARIIIGEQMLQIADQYKVALTVHDSVVSVVPDKDADEAATFMQTVLSLAPSWAADLPLACEVTMGRTYGEV